MAAWAIEIYLLRMLLKIGPIEILLYSCRAEMLGTGRRYFTY